METLKTPNFAKKAILFVRLVILNQYKVKGYHSKSIRARFAEFKTYSANEITNSGFIDLSNI